MNLLQMGDGFLVWSIEFWSVWLIPMMVCIFAAGLVSRFLIHFTIKREEWFSMEFDRRVESFATSFSQYKGPKSFFVMTKKLLEKTYYELFEVRSYMKRRKPDVILAPADRVFLIKQGTAWFVHDILNQIKWLKKDDHHYSKLQTISRKTFKYNPCFSKVLGVFSVSTLHDILSVLPGTFIVFGIFGTFLGIVKGLPDLSMMELSDAASTKNVMDHFILKMAFAMNTSIYGIMFSLVMHFTNIFFSPTKTFVRTVDRFESSLERLWELSDSNDQPKDLKPFDENKDPIEALAEEAVLKGIGKPEDKAA